MEARSFNIQIRGFSTIPGAQTWSLGVFEWGRGHTGGLVSLCEACLRGLPCGRFITPVLERYQTLSCLFLEIREMLPYKGFYCFLLFDYE